MRRFLDVRDPLSGFSDDELEDFDGVCLRDQILKNATGRIAVFWLKDVKKIALN